MNQKTYSRELKRNVNERFEANIVQENSPHEILTINRFLTESNLCS